MTTTPSPDRPEQQASAAARGLNTVLAEAGLLLPSVGVDWPTITGDVLVTLGRARPELVVSITDLLRDGLNARAQHKP